MTEKELARGAARRLAIIRHAQEVAGNVTMTCRYFGITRQAYYIWLRRYQEQGPRGAPGPVTTPPREPERHEGRGHRQDHLPAPQLSLRTSQNRDVCGAKGRSDDRSSRRHRDCRHIVVFLIVFAMVSSSDALGPMEGGNDHHEHGSLGGCRRGGVSCPDSSVSHDPRQTRSAVEVSLAVP